MNFLNLLSNFMYYNMYILYFCNVNTHLKYFENALTFMSQIFIFYRLNMLFIKYLN